MKWAKQLVISDLIRTKTNQSQEYVTTRFYYVHLQNIPTDLLTKLVALKILEIHYLLLALFCAVDQSHRF